MKEKQKNNFIQDRLFNVFDNVLANVAIIAISVIVAFILKLEVQLIFLIVLVVIQILSLFLLFRVHNKLSGGMSRSV